ncbi:MAG: polysaccharide biosynthesis/export family protein [Pyrinomonadaceae bacterium]|nr:polysaccharide biosynthesis/export family protein [Pyrinomonadaceae bacterium]MCX7639724.1 polysaccharide biosynthesis/export family protein [Pyrinomonadaceae bacterium]MDW8304307.1 polysaccharide biosynthesis/export family protein [Acidobacteriota bacterium]
MRLTFFVFIFSLSAFGQDTRNLPFFPNPKAEVNQKTETTLASRTLEVVERKNRIVKSPTETYSVGAGDVLEVRMQGLSTKVRVSEDGTIEYPLASGEAIKVEGLTVEEIEDLLRERTQYTQVLVKVKEYESHKITVLGLVENQGIKVLRRDAVPLYVVLSEAIPHQTAKKIEILRLGEKLIVGFEKLDTLVYPGDVVRVVGEEVENKPQQKKFYYITGEILSPGQKEFHDGITLTQAIAASGGLKKSSIRKVIVRRKNADGKLESMEYDLRAIRNGKEADPALKEGDIIEVEN